MSRVKNQCENIIFFKKSSEEWKSVLQIIIFLLTKEYLRLGILKREENSSDPFWKMLEKCFQFVKS